MGSTKRIPTRVTLAIEVAKSAMDQITHPYELTRLWKHLDWRLSPSSASESLWSVDLVIQVRGIDSLVCATVGSTMANTEAPITCCIALNEQDGPEWMFESIVLDDHLLTVQEDIDSDVDIEWLLDRQRQAHAQLGELFGSLFREFSQFAPHSCATLMAARIEKIDPALPSYFGPIASLKVALNKFDEFMSQREI